MRFSGITIDSRKVQRGFLYVCIEGSQVDGHDFAKQAVDNGAIGILCKTGRRGDMPEDVLIIEADDTRLEMAKICKQYYNDPSKEMKLIGVTGTNGKTSTTSFIEQSLITLGVNVGSIGTLGVRVGGRALDLSFATSTTPDTIELYEILTEMKKQNVEYVVMEVSSHALALHKVAELRFDVGVFTNLSQDHLDFHGDMDSYRLAKAGLFDISHKGIINHDDQTLGFLLDYTKDKCPVSTFGINGGDYKATNPSLQSDGISYIIEGQGINLNIPGKFTIYNSLATFATLDALGFNREDIAQAISKLEGIGGRIQSIPTGGNYNVIVDYAHTPDGLENIISSCREFTTGRVITVFGCGGDRDSTKRPLMGNMAGKLSDICIATSDNPRNEDPAAILAQVEEGLLLAGCEYELIIDREDAIYKAVSIAGDGDCVIIAGKGHEDYQEFEKGRRIDFDDREVAKQAIKDRGQGSGC